MEAILECSICKGSNFDLFLECKDHTVSHETFKIVKCNSCGFVFTNPRPGPDAIGKYYQSEDYISHSNSSKGLFNLLYQQIRRIAIQSKVKLIKSKNPTKRSILDYGSGTGEFLNAMKSEGWNTMGIEPSLQAKEMSIKNYNLDIEEPDSLSKIANENFGVITLWHVLEHVHQLGNTIEQLNRILDKNGILIIAVPNHEAWDANFYKEYWAAYDVPRHLYHFSKNDVIRLFTQLGLKLMEIRPMFFDPFYISLLSEKYLNGKPSYLNAIKAGIATTRAGKIDVTKNSSLIYIFKKNEK